MATAAEAVSRSSESSVIDIEALLAPINGDNPAGVNLQYAGLYDEINEARREDEDLVQGEWKHDRKVADWQRVVSLASDALANRTKDLQVGAWLTEALVKTRGFEGLRDGLTIMRGLLERYWEDVYPEMEEGDLEGRANAIAWLERPVVLPKLPRALKDVAISSSVTGMRYSYLQWEQSREFDVPERMDDLDSDEVRRINELKQRAVDEGKITSEQWRVAKGATPRAFFEEAHSSLSECWTEFHSLDLVIDGKFGRYAPSLGMVKKALDDIRTLVEKIVKEKRLLDPDLTAEEDFTAPDMEGSTEIELDLASSAGPIQTRQEALRRLAEVAGFFRRTEPHSPVSYLVQRAIKWGQMPLESWLQEVIKNDGVLDQLRETLGLNTTPGRGAPDRDGS
jgi:type VI secretion system protein ImpA